MMFSARKGYIEVVKLLICKGASINAKTEVALAGSCSV